MPQEKNIKVNKVGQRPTLFFCCKTQETMLLFLCKFLLEMFLWLITGKGAPRCAVYCFAAV